MRTISRVLVANRGEIARRVFRTCRDMGLSTVAVFSDADAGMPHAREADVAVRLPGSAPADTYLRADLLIEAARRTGADAVHPGYGFLSEDAGFARRLTEAVTGRSPDTPLVPALRREVEALVRHCSSDEAAPVYRLIDTTPALRQYEAAMRQRHADALATADLRRLQLNWTAAAVGSWIFFIVLAVYAYDQGGATAVGIAALARMLPAGLSAPLAGVVVDRRSRREVLLVSTIGRSLVLAAIAAAASRPARRDRDSGANGSTVTVSRPATVEWVQTPDATPSTISAGTGPLAPLRNSRAAYGLGTSCSRGRVPTR